MCGFVGFIDLLNKKNNKIDIATFKAMNESIAHRGPDGEGYSFLGKGYADEPAIQNNTYIAQERNLALAHKRLSIIDRTEEANQPMHSADTRISLLFNGEIYNHLELRQELLNKGYQFKTSHSDTEVIIHAYLEWGIEAVKKFRGMYSIALWDKDLDTLHLVRDKIGIKPMYYTQSKDKLYFASEIKAIIEDSSVKRAIHYKGLYHYLSFLTVPAPNTLFENIYKLPAGHRIEIIQGKVSQPIQYWDIFDDVKLSTQNEEEILKQTLQKLEKSVNYRSVADIPVGVFLSGGIDSSLNAKLFSKNSDYQIKAFSVGYQNDDKLKSYTNEFKYAQLASKDSNAQYFQKELTQQDFIDFLPVLVHHQDEPIGDPVCMPVYYVSKLAKDNNISVCQVGEGSDELFWGYSSWKYMLKLQELNDIKIIPNFVKKIGLKTLKYLGKEDKSYYEWLKRGANNQNVFWSGAEAFSETQKEKLLSQSFREKLPKDYSSWEIIQKHRKDFENKSPEKSHLNWMSYIDLKIRLPELLLMRVDKMSMAVSLEARVPFLDDRFVSYAMSIPSKLKTKNGISKYVLKKAIEGVIPDKIIHRKKQGFDAPVYDWMLDELGVIARQKIDEFNETTNVFNNQYIDKLFEMKNNKQIWYILNVALWWEHFIKQ